MAGFVRVSGYSKKDLDDAYDAGYAQGYIDGTPQGISVYLTSNHSQGKSSSITVRRPGTARLSIFSNCPSSEASASVRLNGTYVWSRDGSGSGRNSEVSFGVAVGDVITCSAYNEGSYTTTLSVSGSIW